MGTDRVFTFALGTLNDRIPTCLKPSMFGYPLDLGCRKAIESDNGNAIWTTVQRILLDVLDLS